MAARPGRGGEGREQGNVTVPCRGGQVTHVHIPVDGRASEGPQSRGGAGNWRH